MSLLKRLGGAFSSACIFFIVTNFGVWVNGSYGYNIEGLIACYTLALPFFGYTAISTLIFSALIETVKFNNTYFTVDVMVHLTLDWTWSLSFDE